MKSRLFSHIKKAAVSALLAGGLLVFGPSFASATTDAAQPTDNFSVVDRSSMPTNLDQTVSADKSTNGTNATFNCYYTVGPQDLWLDCVVQDGAIQVTLYCSDGNVYPSPWFGPGGWLIHGWCTPAMLNAWSISWI